MPSLPISGGGCGRRGGPSARRLTTGRRGAPLAKCASSASYWADGYDWRASEARLNTARQFQTTIDGLGIHFLHVRSPHAGALPLIVTHGWPGSVVEFMKVIGPLTNPGPAARERRVPRGAPSLPGYGFSGKPDRRRAGASSGSPGPGRP